MRFARLLLLVPIAVIPSSLPATDVNQQKVDQIFSTYDKGGSPGCAVGVIRNGDFVYRRGYGEASLERGAALSPESLFYLGSISKQFTAASVVLAAEQGYLSLDDDIRKYIPEVPNYGHAITIRQLLHHTSGLRDFEALLDISGASLLDSHSASEIMDLVVRQKTLNNIPGDEWVYSNTNYFLLAEIVKRATKKSLAQFAAENIFRRLGMAHTLFYDDHTSVVPGRVSGYRESNGKFLENWSPNWDIVGAGGVLSNVEDLLLWDRNFYQNRLGKGTLAKEMLRPALLNSGQKINYALGLELGMYRGLATVEHAGSFPGYAADVLRFPGQRFTVICLCNLSNVQPLTLSRKIADVYLEQVLTQTEPSTISPSARTFPDPTPFAGKYLNPHSHEVFSFTVSKGNLLGWGGILRRISPNQFMDLGSGTITFDSSQGPTTVSLDYLGERFYSGVKVQPPRLTRTALAQFNGDYRSSELGATYRLSLDVNGLWLRNGRNTPLQLTPVAPDEFESNIGTIVFDRDARHRVTALSVYVRSVGNLRFNKISQGQ